MLILSFSGSLSAAQKHLASSPVPTVAAQGKVALLGRLAGTNQMRLAIGLPLRHTDALTNLLRAIYDPTSPQFHHYLTPKEFTARFGPTPAEYATVMRFAGTNGLKAAATHPNRLLMDVTGKVSDVERAFHVRLNSFRHPKENRNFFAPDVEPSVDASLPVLSVSGLDNFSLPHPLLKMCPSGRDNQASPRGGSGPGGGYLGQDLRQAYVPDTPLTGAGQNIGLVQFDGFYTKDITNYAYAVGLTNVPSLIIVPVDGGVTSPGAGNLEVSLDIEMLLAMAPGISNIYVYEAPNPSPWVDMLDQMADDNLASQLSSSWGGGGPDAAAEQIFLQMAAQGQTFFNATGDLAAFTGPIEFPSDSPNITQVGGTTLATDTNGNYVSETVWNWGGGQASSGGVSTSVAIPPWQLGISMAANGGSATFRNIPDVAFTADNIYVFYGNGTNGLVGGTSCSAPLWAGFTALANERAAQLGQPPLGFLNPAIYGLCRGTNYSTTFNDITNGANTSFSSPTNFYAVPGYDLCTGWGTPVGTNLINALTTPDNLVLLPQTNFTANGLVGGPFTPMNWSLTLTNTGSASLDWSFATVPSWLSISAIGGTLAAYDSTNIDLQLSGAELLPGAHYSAVLELTNLTLSRVQTLAVQLDIGQSIVQNGGFETGDFSGWTLVGDTVMGQSVYNIVAADNNFSSPVQIVHSGHFGAFLGQNGYLATLTQALPTSSNQLYQLSFWLDDPQPSTPQQFIARWNGAGLVNFSNPPPFIWTNFQFLVTAVSTNTALQFAAQNDMNYFGLDDVVVIPVPPLKFARIDINGSNLDLAWNSLAGLHYDIQSSTNLGCTNWEDLAALTAGTNVCSFVDTNILNLAGLKFYRLVLEP